MNKKLYKISAQKKVAGVCAGLAEYFNADPTLIRVLTLLIILCSFSLGLIFYIGCALIMPDKSELM
ncbi:PspC domain-containing protein [Clostridium tertium]|uniref:Phage shock protein C n=1 Tax=Clostridium tertium TaxID=1559 RepID=A0A6N3DGW6_9CLOT